MKPNYMNITEQQEQEDERIDAYLKDKLSSKEEIKFLEELEANPKMKARAIAIAKMIKTMKTAGIKRDAEAIDVLRRMKMEDVEKMTKDVFNGHLENIKEKYAKKCEAEDTYNTSKSELEIIEVDFNERVAYREYGMVAIDSNDSTLGKTLVENTNGKKEKKYNYILWVAVFIIIMAIITALYIFIFM